MEKFKNSYFSYMLMYFGYFMANCFASSLISVYLLDMGMSDFQVSVVITVANILAFLFNPLVGVLQQYVNKKRIITILYAGACICGLILFLRTSYVLMLTVYALFFSFLSCADPIIEYLGSHGPFAYGKIRIFGSLGAAIGSQLTALVYDWIAPRAIFAGVIIFVAIGYIGIINTSEKNLSITQNPNANARKGKATDLIRNRTFLFYALLYLIHYGVCRINATYMAPLFTTSGLSVSLVGTVSFISIMCELPFVLNSHRFMDKISNKALLIALFSLLTIQYSTYAFAKSLVVKVIVTFATRNIDAMTFIMTNLKIVNTIVEDDLQPTALSVLHSMNFIGGSLFLVISGKILDLGATYTQLYMYLAMFTVLGIVLSAVYRIPSGIGKRLFSRK